MEEDVLVDRSGDAEDITALIVWGWAFPGEGG